MREGERENEGVRDCGGSGERERDKKRDIHSRLTNQRERGGGGGGHFKRVPGPKRKSERKTGMEGGGPQTGEGEGEGE